MTSTFYDVIEDTKMLAMDYRSAAVTRKHLIHVVLFAPDYDLTIESSSTP